MDLYRFVIQISYGPTLLLCQKSKDWFPEKLTDNYFNDLGNIKIFTAYGMSLLRPGRNL